MPVILVLKAYFAFQVASFSSSLILIVSPLLLPVTFFLLPNRKQTPKRVVRNNNAFRHLCLLKNKDDCRTSDCKDSTEQKEYETIGFVKHELDLKNKCFMNKNSLKE